MESKKISKSIDNLQLFNENKDLQLKLMVTIKKYNAKIQEKRKTIEFLFKIKEADQKKLNNLYKDCHKDNPKYQQILTEIRMLQKDIIATKKIIAQMLDEEAEIWKKITCCKIERSKIIKID